MRMQAWTVCVRLTRGERRTAPFLHPVRGDRAQTGSAEGRKSTERAAGFYYARRSRARGTRINVKKDDPDSLIAEI